MISVMQKVGAGDTGPSTIARPIVADHLGDVIGDFMMPAPSGLMDTGRVARGPQVRAGRR